MFKNIDLDLVENMVDVVKIGSNLYDKVFNPNIVHMEQILMVDLLCGIQNIILSIRDKIRDN